MRIVIEGLQGEGKSTLVAIIADDLAARGFGIALERGTERNNGIPPESVIIEERTVDA